jgi:hypothetical protein
MIHVNDSEFTSGFWLDIGWKKEEGLTLFNLRILLTYQDIGFYEIFRLHIGKFVFSFGYVKEPSND